MSDNVPATPTPAAQPAAAPESATPNGAVDPAVPAQETDWKIEARKWEARAKENSSAATRLAEIEEANKTAEQKAADRLAAAETKAAALELKAARAEVAAEKGVPMGLISGSDRAEMEAAADALIAFKAATPAAPKPDFSQGAQGQPTRITTPGADTFAAGVRL